MPPISCSQGRLPCLLRPGRRPCRTSIAPSGRPYDVGCCPSVPVTATGPARPSRRSRRRLVVPVLRCDIMVFPSPLRFTSPILCTALSVAASNLPLLVIRRRHACSARGLSSLGLCLDACRRTALGRQLSPPAVEPSTPPATPTARHAGPSRRRAGCLFSETDRYVVLQSSSSPGARAKWLAQIACRSQTFKGSTLPRCGCTAAC